MTAFTDLKFGPRNHLAGVQARHTFPNGYEASVTQGQGTYGVGAGLYEMAVMYDGYLVYDTPVTDDVLGYLTEVDVTRHLAEIEALPPRSNGGAA